MKLRIFLAIFAMMIAATFGGSQAQAQATRTWVSGVGDDVNPCSRTAPCKTFAGAISKTAAGGEINCLDPAGYGAVTITKSITIDCEDTQGAILASSTTGVIINGAGAIVTIRGISINGGTPSLPGINGIRFLQGSTLNVEECVIFNFTAAGASSGFGIIANHGSGVARINVRNSVIRNNGAVNAGGGIGIFPTGSAGARVELNNVTLSNNADSALVVNTNGNAGGSGISVEAVDTQFSGSNNGVLLNQPAGTANVTAMLTRATITDNVNNGIFAAGAGIVMRVGDSVITGNGLGVSSSGGAQVLSFGTNQLEGNPFIGAPNNGAFSGAIIPPK